MWVDGCGGVSSFREAKRPALTPQFVSDGVVLHRSPNFLSRTLSSSTRLVFLSETEKAGDRTRREIDPGESPFDASDPVTFV